jgi:hypothetical protein
MTRAGVRGPLVLLPLALVACGDLDDEEINMLRWPLTAQCKINVVGKGTKDLEGDYLPHVITCENGGAATEALKVQAVAARTFAYYKIATAGSVKDGTGDQVYTCGSQPQQKHYDAVKATAGQVLMWSNVVICSFFVAGAKPSTSSCVAKASDPDPTNTERYVTYNEGKTGSAVTQSTLGWVSSTNKYNRGCMSQNGSHCQAVKSKGYKDILRFYYGADIQLVTAVGSCVTPPPTPKPDSGVTKKDSQVKTADASSKRLDGGAPPQSDLGPAPAPDASAPTKLDGGGIPVSPIRGEGGCSVAPLGTGASASGAALLLLGLALGLASARRGRGRGR